MADYIKRIRTADGDKQIDYEALANKPDARFEAIEKGMGDIDTALEAIIAIQEGLIGESKITYVFSVSGTVFTIKGDIGMTWADAVESEELTAIGQGFRVRDNGYVACWLQNYIKKQEYTGETTEDNISEWGIKATDKVINGCVYVPSDVYDFEG